MLVLPLSAGRPFGGAGLFGVLFGFVGQWIARTSVEGSSWLDYRHIVCSIGGSGRSEFARVFSRKALEFFIILSLP